MLCNTRWHMCVARFFMRTIGFPIYTMRVARLFMHTTGPSRFVRRNKSFMLRIAFVLLPMYLAMLVPKYISLRISKFVLLLIAKFAVLHIARDDMRILKFAVLHIARDDVLWIPRYPRRVARNGMFIARRSGWILLRV